MKRYFLGLLAFITAFALAIVSAPVASASISGTNATNACFDDPGYGGSIRSKAAGVLGHAVDLYVTDSAPAEWDGTGASFWTVRIRAMSTNYADRRAVWFNCLIRGWDWPGHNPPYGWSYFYSAPAPNYIIDTANTPNWQYHYFPFADPSTGHVW